jgi:sirohydrochlorin ferrochelatase
MWGVKTKGNCEVKTLKKHGVLVIAHGSSKKDWVQLVDEAVNQVDIDLPVVSCFLEMVEYRSIPDGIRQLEGQGVNEIIAVPLFVSSGSTHIEEISYSLGLNLHPKLENEEEPFKINAVVRVCNAMDDHPLISKILIERAKEMSIDPKQEIVLLVGHGSELEGFKEVWEKGMASLAVKIHQEVGFAAVSYATMQPDNLHYRLRTLSRKNRVLVLPMFLSEGYFTRKMIPSRMEGLNYVYTGKTYLPHPYISQWIEGVVLKQCAIQKEV